MVSQPTAPPHRGESAAPAAAAPAVAPPAAVKKMSAIDCSDGEEEGNDSEEQGSGNDNDNKTDDDSIEFVEYFQKTQSLGSDVYAKAVAEATFAFSAFAGGGNAKKFAMVCAGSCP